MLYFEGQILLSFFLYHVEDKEGVGTVPLRVEFHRGNIVFKLQIFILFFSGFQISNLCSLPLPKWGSELLAHLAHITDTAHNIFLLTQNSVCSFKSFKSWS